MRDFDDSNLTYSDGDGTALSTLLGWERVRSTEVGSPVTSADWENRELGNDDSGADGSCDFLGGLDTETNVSLGVTDDNDGLETGALTGTGLLLDGLDLYNIDSQHSAHFRRPNLRARRFYHTFMTSSLSFGRKKSTIWYSLIGRE